MLVIIQSHVVVRPSFLVDGQEQRQICFLGSYFCCAGKMWLGSLSCIAGTSHNQYWTWRQTNYLFNLFQNRNQAAFSPTEVASFKRRIQVTEWSETSFIQNLFGIKCNTWSLEVMANPYFRPTFWCYESRLQTIFASLVSDLNIHLISTLAMCKWTVIFG